MLLVRSSLIVIHKTKLGLEDILFGIHHFHINLYNQCNSVHRGMVGRKLGDSGACSPQDLYVLGDQFQCILGP